ncbi:copper chaperone PCu(A)C [Micromonospora sp. NBC_01796]|uniref:copper chaperone PCu(A)C n=1 Tax=Micromonospora sp. NBC_01796 TaxID=2975987 RepID=UPI002DD82130|nr:copper chaperone PCu(A)C [Micromonospora sp. NBC_01796]WSA84533.1 copper chaperone PCu(A)C [Micromonospora sp. NBC_01796]
MNTKAEEQMSTAASPVPRRRPALLTIASAAVAALALIGTAAGCGGSEPSGTGQASPSASSTTGAFNLRDPWVKAADSGMTAAFGTLVNDGDTDVTVVSAVSSVSPMELHEMAMKDGKMVMQPKTGGFVIKAKGTHVLEPSGDHLMLMNLVKPVKPGDEVIFTLTFADGRTAEFAAIVKPFAGAGESYDPSTGMNMSPGASPATGMNMSPTASPGAGMSMSPPA